MRPYDLIYKKREGKPLTEKEIRFLIDGYTKGEIPDYQMSAWAMCVFFKSMIPEETVYLTTAMAESGDQVDLSSISGFKVDKHSTGGVGDTTTLVLAPLVSAVGIPVAKMSGRGLGHTGGTIDKLESIPGFKTDLSREQFIKNVNEIGLAVVGQTGNLTPADKKLYSLRDVTASVDSIPLIASSIMSKKIAGGADGIVLDVKTGQGAFMKGYKEAYKLAETMVEIGENVNLKTRAVITDMNQPLGFAVGNSLEVKEAINTLKGKGPEDLEKLCLNLGTHMLMVAGKVSDFDKGYNLLQKEIESGRALQQFTRLVEAQGGDTSIVDNLDLLPQAQHKIEITSKKDGFIHKIDALEIGLSAMMAGAGRKVKDDEIDLSAGVILKKKVGDEIGKGEVLAELHINESESINIQTRIINAFTIEDKKINPRKLIYEVIV